jgi:DinB superfamily
MFSSIFAQDHQPSASTRKQTFYLVGVLLLMAVAVVPIAAQTPQTSPRMTDKDRELAIGQLNASREKFVKAVSGLSEAQLKFKSAPDRWSVADVAEHITLSEEFLFNLLNDKVLKGPATPDKERKITDEQILAMVSDRSNKAQAPEPLKPTNKWQNITETMQEFETRRARTIDFVKTTNTDLRSHFSAFGPRGEVDALQWVLFMSAHVDRHVAQIDEVKSDPNFPKK